MTFLLLCGIAAAGLRSLHAADATIVPRAFDALRDRQLIGPLPIGTPLSVIASRFDRDAEHFAAISPQDFRRC
jgi:hypothetical protein